MKAALLTPDEVALEDPKGSTSRLRTTDGMMIWLMSRFPSRGNSSYFDPDDEDMYPPGDGPGGNPDDHQGGQPPGPPPTGSVAGPNQFRKSRCSFGATRDIHQVIRKRQCRRLRVNPRPPDDPGQPPIGFPSDTDPVHPFVPSPDSNHAGARTICSGES